MTDEAELLARFCAELAQLRSLVRGPASAARRAVLEQTVRAARRGEPIGPLIAGFGDRVHNLAPYSAPRSALPVELPEVDSPPVTGVFLCPRDACRRVEVRRAGAEVPSCDIHEQSLRFVADN